MDTVLYKTKSPDGVLVMDGASSSDPMNEEDLLLAATLVEDAINGRFLCFKTDKRSVRSYRLYYHWSLRWLQHVAVAAILALALFERPAVVECDLWITTVVEVVILTYFVVRVLHSAHFQNKVHFWKDAKNIVACVAIALCFIDLICYYIWYYEAPGEAPVRWSRWLRPLFIVNFPQGRQVRTAFRNIRRSLREIAFVIFLVVCSMLLFALLALKLFGKRQLTYPDGRPYLTNYWDCLWSLYVLITTANNPDIMMPAYDSNRWFALFFIIYLVLNLYIFMHILLAVIFNSYKKQLKNEVKESVYAKRRKLAQAFDVIRIRAADEAADDGSKSAGRTKYLLPRDRWLQLLKTLDRRWSTEQADILFHVLDEDGDDHLAKKEFLQMTEVLEVRLIEVKEKLTLFESCCPMVYLSSCSYSVRSWVQHKYFRYFFDVAIAVNAVVIAFDELSDGEWFFLGLFSLEILLKLYSYGFRRFALNYWNVFDTIVVLAAFVATVIETVDGLGSSREVLDIVLVLRCLRLVKLFTGIDRLKVIIMTVVNIGPSILTYGGVLFVFYYVFAIVGMEAFGSRVAFYGYNETAQSKEELFCGNALLNGSEFYRSRYCSNNFNNILNAFVVLFELTVVNQWHVLASGFATVTHEAAKIYFMCFHLTCVVLVVNIFVAFILEAFILEYSLSRNKYETAIETRIKDMGYKLGQPKALVAPSKKTTIDKAVLVDYAEEPEPIRTAGPTPSSLSSTSVPPEGHEPRVSEDARSEEVTGYRLQTRVFKKVGMLLQQMFESEIDPEDMGLDATDEYDSPANTGLKPRKMTLDLL